MWLESKQNCEELLQGIRPSKIIKSFVFPFLNEWVFFKVRKINENQIAVKKWKYRKLLGEMENLLEVSVMCAEHQIILDCVIPPGFRLGCRPMPDWLALDAMCQDRRISAIVRDARVVFFVWGIMRVTHIMAHISQLDPGIWRSERRGGLITKL
jgi:hypothetical protein